MLLWNRDNKIIMSYPVNNEFLVVKVQTFQGEILFGIIENIGGKNQELWMEHFDCHNSLPSAFNKALTYVK